LGATGNDDNPTKLRQTPLIAARPRPIVPKSVKNTTRSATELFSTAIHGPETRKMNLVGRRAVGTHENRRHDMSATVAQALPAYCGSTLE
jgi:hypothetical protein